MKLKIVFYPDGRWEGGGMLPRRLQDFTRLADWIRRFLEEVKDLRTHYTESMQNDGRLLGQEKANLVIEMEEVIAGLVLFRRYLTEEHPGRITAGSSSSFKYNIQIYETHWTGNGELASNDKLDRMSFADLHNDLILRKIKIVFARYGAAVGDGLISEDERKSLHSGIDQLLGDFFRIERRLICD
ncbi:MAG: hypothetical protein JEZ04_21200 [Spirochaetales bacterium]|nr:hypothetical protein [Spirochaetales bacterium]